MWKRWGGGGAQSYTSGHACAAESGKRQEKKTKRLGGVAVMKAKKKNGSYLLWTFLVEKVDSGKEKLKK